MRLTFLEKEPLTSISKRAVVVMKAQAQKNIVREGKNPERPDKIGRPSMPAPMQLPAISSMPPTMLPSFDLDTATSSLHFFNDSDLLTQAPELISIIVDEFEEALKLRNRLRDQLGHFLCDEAVRRMACSN